MALVSVAGCGFGKIGGVGGGGLFLDLEKERVGGLGAGDAFEVDTVVAQADGAGADYLERYVDRAILCEEMAAFGLQRAGVGAEGCEDGFGFFFRNGLQQRRLRAEAAGLAVIDGLGEFRERLRWSGTLGGAED